MDQLKRIKRNMTPGQLFFFLIMIPMLSLTPIMYKFCNEFQRYRVLERPDFEFGNWSDFAMILFIVPVIALLKYLVKRYTEEYFVTNLKRKYSGEVLSLKTQKCTKNCFKLFYFLFITCFGLYVYSETTFHSSLMLGSGDIRYLLSDWPYNKMPNLLTLYYMIGLSYHVEDAIHHFYVPAQNDFFEMLLHHYITVVLIACSYMTQHWNFGINVMIQMDNGDIFVGSIKAFMDFGPSYIVLPNYFILVGTWIYFRVFVYTYEVIWHGALSRRAISDLTTNYQTYFQFLLLGLLLLNIYWSILFMRIGIRLAKKGTLKDMQNPSEDMYKKKKAISK